jgi:hypothetical protein
MRVLQYLVNAYGPRRRRLGPLAVLHPLAAAALLARASERVSLLGLLTCLLHDKNEDLTREKLGEECWNRVETDFRGLLGEIDPAGKWYLMERLDWLTRRPEESYFQYIGRMLDHVPSTPSVFRVKLADRLSNVMDMVVDIADPMSGVDFFDVIFQGLYVNSFKGHKSSTEHPYNPMKGSERLYQLFKAAVIMSLYRQRRIDTEDATTRILFDSLARAGMKEAQRIVLHLFRYHLSDVKEQRDLLMDVLDYSQKGYLDKATLPNPKLRLDGLFLTRFDDSDRNVRKQKLDQLYDDKPLMLEAAMAFVVINQNFLCDPEYFVRGITEEGVRP